MELAAFALVLCGALAWLVFAPGLAGRRGVGAFLCAAGLAGLALWWGHLNPRLLQAEQLLGQRPIEVRDDGYVSSNACRACHPAEYASWHATYHRTMTQAVSPASVIADFDDVTLSWRGASYRLRREGDQFWVDLSTPPDETQSHRVVMSTGSHYNQVYWMETGEGRRVRLLPFSFLKRDMRWVPREAAYLVPPNAASPGEEWHERCIQCHSTHGRPRRDRTTGLLDTQVAELGIACESCHGPGAEHVRVNRDPARRYASHFDDDGGDPTIVQPERLSARRSSEVCGQCHSSFLTRVDENRKGSSYRPGADLSESRLVVQPALHLAQGGPPGWPHAQQWLLENPGWLAERFWSDGQNRVRGREYNDIQASACFRGGELSCLSCHSMHDADPDKLVRADRSGDAGCLVCHAEYAAQIEAHAHHPPGSEGARCTNCHMPNTTYGMLGAQRSHTINSPDVASGQASGRPNACNLCHLDQTLAWTQQRLEAWYGVAPVELSRDEREIAASVLWLLRGDAGQRALVAWHMGWAPAQQASTADWLAAYLAESLIDPYAAVRYIGHHALMTLPGFEDVQYDYLAPRRARMAAASAVEQRWQQRAAATPPDRGARLLLDPAGIDRDRRAQLLRERDHRPIVLAE